MTVRNPEQQKSKDTIKLITKVFTFGGLLFVVIGLATFFYGAKEIGLGFIILGSIEGIMLPPIIRKIFNKRNRR